MSPAASVEVLVPWRDTGCPWRARALELVQAFYAEALGWPVRLCDADPARGPFSRSRALNAGAAASQADVLVIADADSLVRPHQVLLAVERARQEPGLVYAYTRYCRLSRMRTELLSDWGQALEQTSFVFELEGAPSQGCVAVDRGFWMLVGGMDDGFVGWGFEDMAFAAVCARVRAPWRVNGPLIHLWHPASDGRDEADRDQATTREHMENLRRYREMYA